MRHELDGGAKAELAQRLEELESLREELALARQHDSELADRIVGEEDKTRNFQQQLAELAAEHEDAEGRIQPPGRRAAAAT